MRLYLDGNFELNKIEGAILRNLYKFRLLTTEQILFLIFPELVTDSFPINPKNNPSWRKNYQSKYSRVRKELLRFEEFRFVRSQHYKVMAGRSALSVFTLDIEKFNVVKDLLDIDPSHFGSGWNDDFGDLSIDFFDFPKRIEHHLDSVNFYIRMQFLSPQFSFMNEIDYVDNVYAARTYSLENGDAIKFRPDGEMKIHGFRQEKKNPTPGFHAWIEIDRATEFSNDLSLKFENYRGFLAHATATKAAKPPIIMVFTTASTKIGRRWNSFFNAYQSNLMNYSPFMNMLVCNADNLFQTLSSFTERSGMLLKVKQRIEGAAKPDMGFLGTVHMGTARNHEHDQDPFTALQLACHDLLGWAPQFVITENNPNRVQLYLFQKFDGYETQGICRVLDFLRKWSQFPDELKRVKEIVPVFYFKYGSPVGVPKQIDDCTDEERTVLSRSLWYGTEQEAWYDETLKLMKSESVINPLTYGLHQKV
ncbi:hypothetical protein M5X11_12900 [Paenibacillus alginolyticus]|uniref:hypothetical protein n=1 Tax=Paenibacillus alginolyticus TaxID=59839 RepID=UPI000419AD98|nr:hypothetical protein [Paenibacillus alginolyticus]MCY9665853.1 hypothetical protein [Paenibacillus alginolyticus]